MMLCSPLVARPIVRRCWWWTGWMTSCWCPCVGYENVYVLYVSWVRCWWWWWGPTQKEWWTFLLTAYRLIGGHGHEGGKGEVCDAETAIEWNISWHYSLILLLFIKGRYFVYSVPRQMMLRGSDWTERVVQILFILWGSVVCKWTTYSQSHSLPVAVHSTWNGDRSDLKAMKGRAKGISEGQEGSGGAGLEKLIHCRGWYNNKRGCLAPHLGLRESVSFGAGQSVILIIILSPWHACDRGSD